MVEFSCQRLWHVVHSEVWGSAPARERSFILKLSMRMAELSVVSVRRVRARSSKSSLLPSSSCPAVFSKSSRIKKEKAESSRLSRILRNVSIFWHWIRV